jgi:hypothetical protein
MARSGEMPDEISISSRNGRANGANGHTASRAAHGPENPFMSLC